MKNIKTRFMFVILASLMIVSNLSFPQKVVASSTDTIYTRVNNFNYESLRIHSGLTLVPHNSAKNLDLVLDYKSLAGISVADLIAIQDLFFSVVIDDYYIDLSGNTFDSSYILSSTENFLLNLAIEDTHSLSELELKSFFAIFGILEFSDIEISISISAFSQYYIFDNCFFFGIPVMAYLLDNVELFVSDMLKTYFELAKNNNGDLSVFFKTQVNFNTGIYADPIESVYADGSIVLPTPIMKDGYIGDCWQDITHVGNPMYNFGEVVVVDGDMVQFNLVAHEQVIIKYDINFNTFSVAEAILPMAVSSGNSIVLPFPVMTSGYRGLHWQYNGVALAFGAIYTPLENVTLTLVYESLVRCTLSFNVRNKAAPISDITVYKGETITLPTPFMTDGYSGKCWSLGSQIYSFNSEYIVNENILFTLEYDVTPIVYEPVQDISNFDNFLSGLTGWFESFFSSLSYAIRFFIYDTPEIFGLSIGFWFIGFFIISILFYNLFGGGE